MRLYLSMNTLLCCKHFSNIFWGKANSFEGSIREATHAAEDIIELLMLKQIHESRYGLIESSVGPSEPKFDHQLRGRCRQIHESRDVLVKSTAGPSKSDECKDQQRPRRDKIRSSLGVLKSTFRSLKSKLRMEKYVHLHELNKITKEVESIAEKMMEIKNSVMVKDVQHNDSIAANTSPRVAPIHKDAMVGFDDDLMEIESRLCGEPSTLEVIPIAGMGGIGKTTLARNLYDDPLIMEYFQIRVWVTVSHDYSVQDIVSSLLASMKVFNAKKTAMKAHHVHQNLKGRRYLIVLDDLWSVEAWDDLKLMFPDDRNGSRIMLTTRLFDVARYPDSHSRVHEMRLMDEDQSWNLLRQRVFKQDHCPLELEDIGKMIAGSCRGLPLAIVVISGILTSVDQTATAWNDIAKNIKSAISEKDEQFDKILSLSYTRLPHHLRPCFLYMASFPEDYKMRVSKLIKLWAAEGFIKPSESNTFEETAEEYLEELVKRSLVLVTKRKSNGRIKIFSMHDLMREMCIRKAQEENFILYVHRFLPKDIKVPRRLSLLHNGSNFLEGVYTTVRTVISLKHYYSWRPLFCFRLLRILDLPDSHDYNFHYSYLPNKVFEVFHHLRYLACHTPNRIPEAISNLQNLQTLITFPRISTFSVRLPKEIWRMPQLRHLVGFFHLSPLQDGEAVALENLQTLYVVRDLICTPKMLKMIPNLRKMGLCYTRSGNIYDTIYQLRYLRHLKQLQNLKLEISNFPFNCWEIVKPAFPRTLKKLTLSGLRLPWEDLNIVGSLPNLEVLKLRHQACVGETWETTGEEFSQLRFLLIHDLDLHHWITESSHLPRLGSLVLRRCWHLTEIPDGVGEIPTLELIELDDLNEAVLASAKQIQYDQQSSGCNALQVRLVRD